MKKLILTVFCVLVMVCFASAYDLCFEWTANTETDLAGYRIFYHVEGDAYNYNTPIWEGTETTCCLAGFEDLTRYYFVARAFDTEGFESANSNEVQYYCDPYIETPPAAPSGFKIIPSP